METEEQVQTVTAGVQHGQPDAATVMLGNNGMVRIPAGTFTMGSPLSETGRQNAKADETRHSVTISRSFQLGKTEVTQGHWKAVMGGNPSKFSGCGDASPVEQVSWNNVIEFCNRLSDREGLSRCYSGNGNEISWNKSCTGYRLPTESEWEYAARAGKPTRFACGDSDSCLDSVSWTIINSDRKTHPVAQKQANAWGLYDMHGNVAEWVWDWKADYPTGSITDPTGPIGGSVRVFRGGSWDDGAWGCRSARRVIAELGYHDFRLARSLP